MDILCRSKQPEAIEELWSSLKILNLILVIDDGSCLLATKIFFDNSIHMLAEGGFYIIEDILLTEKDIALLITSKKKIFLRLCY